MFYKKYGDKGPVVIILHGLFGMSDNWHNVARSLSDELAVYCLDLRNHGRSPHSNFMSYSSMADDVWEFMQKQRLHNAILIGHSMGGKVAMKFTDKYPDKVSGLVVVDIAPKRYKNGHDLYFRAMRNLDLNATSRKEIEDQLSKSITDRGEMLFILKNLERKDAGGYRLKLNLDAIEQNYEQIAEGIQFRNKIGVPTCLIKGQNSGYINEEDRKEFQNIFTDFSFFEVENAGHWVHAENPAGFLQAIQSFIQ